MSESVLLVWLGVVAVGMLVVVSLMKGGLL